jgi:hypothetical protein
MVVYGSVRQQNNIIWTEASEAVYGPVRHQKKYYMDRSFCHMIRSDMNYLLYYNLYLK